MKISVQKGFLHMKILTWVVLFLGIPLSSLAADDLDGWRIVQVSAADRLAVAKSPEGDLHLVRTGDRLGEWISVIGFDDERVILERPGEWGRATLFVRVADGRQQVERKERQPLRKSDVAGAQAPITVQSENGDQTDDETRSK